MRKTIKRTAVAALAGVMAAGMLTGCGAKELDGTKIVSTVNGTEIPMGMVSLYAREQQAQTAAMYMSFLGSAANIWDNVDEETGETYGEQAVRDSLEAIELMYVMKEKAADYGVEVTDEDRTAIAEAAAAFMAENDEETLKELAVTEDQVKELLELQTYRQRIYDSVAAEGNIEVTDEEANQSAFSYVSIPTSSEELTEEDKTKRKEDAQTILDKMKEDPTADMEEVAKSVDETYTSLSGKFTTVKNDDVDDVYPEEVMEVLRTLKEGEVAAELIETEMGYYIVRLDKETDEEATENKKESLKESKERDYYLEVTEKWLEEADTKVDEKVLKTLTITDNHAFSFKPAETEETAEESAEEETTEESSEEETTEESAEETAADEELEEETETTEK